MPETSQRRRRQTRRRQHRRSFQDDHQQPPAMVEISLEQPSPYNATFSSQDELLRKAMRKRSKNQFLLKQKETQVAETLKQQQEKLSNAATAQAVSRSMRSQRTTDAPLFETMGGLTQEDLLQQAVNRRAAHSQRGSAHSLRSVFSNSLRLGRSLMPSAKADDDDGDAASVTELHASSRSQRAMSRRARLASRLPPRPCSQTVASDDADDMDDQAYGSDGDDQPTSFTGEVNFAPKGRPKRIASRVVPHGATSSGHSRGTIMDALESSLRLGRTFFGSSSNASGRDSRSIRTASAGRREVAIEFSQRSFVSSDQSFESEYDMDIKSNDGDDFMIGSDDEFDFDEHDDDDDDHKHNNNNSNNNNNNNQRPTTQKKSLGFRSRWNRKNKVAAPQSNSNAQSSIAVKRISTGAMTNITKSLSDGNSWTERSSDHTDDDEVDDEVLVTALTPKTCLTAEKLDRAISELEHMTELAINEGLDTQQIVPQEIHFQL